MDAAKKIILALWLVILTVAHASAFAPLTSENRVWKNLTPALETHQVESAQTPDTHQENSGSVYDLASGCCLAAKEATTLYHYTGEANVASILEKGLTPGASGKVFTTTNGGLTPLQAQIELALSPNRGLPGAMLEIDAAGLRAAGIKPSLGPLRVQPTSTAPGGGIETIFDQQIPPEFIKRAW